MLTIILLLLLLIVFILIIPIILIILVISNINNINTNTDNTPLPHPFVLYAPWTGGSFLSLGLGQPWPCRDLLPLLALLFGIAFHLQLVLLSYHPIFLRPYHFLKLVSFLGANRTKSASVCLWLLRGA